MEARIVEELLRQIHRFNEFKGFNLELSIECKTSSLTSEDGVVTVPTGPGLGVDIDSDYIAKHDLVKV